MRVQVTRQQGAHERAKSGLKAQLADIRQVLDATSRQLESRQRNLKALKDQLGVEQIARHTAEQHSRDLAARLAEAERHKEAAALATELGTIKQALYLERESGRNLTQKVKQSQAVETRLVILEAQLAHSQTRLAQAEEASVRATELCNELRQQKALLEGQLDGAKSAIALEERLAKLCYKNATRCIYQMYFQRSVKFTSESFPIHGSGYRLQIAHNLYYVKYDTRTATPQGAAQAQTMLFPFADRMISSCRSLSVLCR